MKARTSNRFAFAIWLTVLALIGTVCAADPQTPSPTAPAEVVHRIVFQVTIDGEDNWNAVLNQIENVRAAFAPEKVEIEVVTHGEASGFVLSKNKAVSERIQKIETTGAVFAYCHNTQKKYNVKTEDLTSGVVIVPSGLAEVIRKQEEGWSYIKAGP